jgi:hypothetical protein
MAKFVILMHEDDGAWMRLPAAERDRLLPLYYAWVRELKAGGIFAGGEPIGGGGRVLRGAGAKSSDASPDGDRDGDGAAIRESDYVQAKGVLTGFFLIEAKDLAAATEIARGCPALLHGETVVVRPVGHGG